MSAMSDAVDNGPRMKQARSAKIAAEIELCRDEATAAKHLACEHRRKGQGEGARAWYHRGAAKRWDAEAAKLTKRAHDLKVDLAKAKADEAARNVKHVKRTAGSTAAEGLVPKTPGQPGPTKAGQVAKPAGQPGQGKRHPSGLSAKRRCQRCDDKQWVTVAGGIRVCEPCANEIDYPPHPVSNPGGTMPSTVSGEAVNVEQTRANLNQLKGQVTDLRGSFEAASGSLASGGLNQLAGSLASADDSLDSVLTQIAAAEKHLSDQEAIAEAAQAAGEMHTDTSFYG